MLSIREQIILEFLARAALIVSTGSPQEYSTDIGGKVLRAVKDVGPDECPLVAVWPQPETAVMRHGKSFNTMVVKVDGIVLFGATDPSVAGEQVMADIIKCFASPSWDRRRAQEGSPVTYLDPLAESVIYIAGGVDAPEPGNESIGAWAQFQVTYYTGLGDPYNQ